MIWRMLWFVVSSVSGSIIIIDNPFSLLETMSRRKTTKKMTSNRTGAQRRKHLLLGSGRLLRRIPRNLQRKDPRRNHDVSVLAVGERHFPLTLMCFYRWTTGGSRVRARDGIRTPYEGNARELVASIESGEPHHLSTVPHVLVVATNPTLSRRKRDKV